MSSESSSSAEKALIYNPSDAKASLISLNMNGITKLTSTNFITWRLQVQALLKAHELHVFIYDSDQTPPENITAADGSAQPDPEFVVWKRQDRLLYNSILGTLTLNIQPAVARTTTTWDIWLLLHNTYGKPTRAHIKVIKQQLNRSNKGTQSVVEYMWGILAKVDQLSLLGSALEHEDFLDHIIDGLNDDYRVIVERVNGRDIPISLDELHEKLLHQENMLTIIEEVSGPSAPITSNTVQNRSYQQQQQRPQFCGNNQSRGGFQGRGRGYHRKCQICGVQGHSARRCPQYSSGTSNFSGPAPYRTLIPSFQHSQWQAPSPPMSPDQWNLQPHNTVSSQYDMSMTPWLLDSGASHHIASDLSNLSLHSPYQGGDDVTIGNGARVAD